MSSKLNTGTIINLLLLTVLVLGVYYASQGLDLLRNYSVTITATLLGLLLAFFFDKRENERVAERERTGFLEDIKEELNDKRLRINPLFFF